VRLVDAQSLPFVGEFDAVVSNAVLHWIPDLTAVLNGVHRALRSHGRFVGESAVTAVWRLFVPL